MVKLCRYDVKSMRCRKTLFEVGRVTLITAGIIVYVTHIYSIYLFSFQPNHQLWVINQRKSVFKFKITV